jgi:hypothetical protein
MMRVVEAHGFEDRTAFHPKLGVTPFLEGADHVQPEPLCPRLTRSHQLEIALRRRVCGRKFVSARTYGLLRKELRRVHAGESLRFPQPEGILGALERRVSVLAPQCVDFDLGFSASNGDDASASHGFLPRARSQLFAWNFAWNLSRYR